MEEKTGGGEGRGRTQGGGRGGRDEGGATRSGERGGGNEAVGTRGWERRGGNEGVGTWGGWRKRGGGNEGEEQGVLAAVWRDCDSPAVARDEGSLEGWWGAERKSHQTRPSGRSRSVEMVPRPDCLDTRSRAGKSARPLSKRARNPYGGHGP